MIDANGISLYVEDHGDGVPMVLLHGWPDSAWLWPYQVPVLADSGFRVIAPDIRGYARGSWGPKEADRLLTGREIWYDPAG